MPPDTDTTARIPACFLNAAANEACKDGATVECAAAWEEVDGLEDAAMRAGMTQNAPEGFEPPPAATAAAAAPEPRASEDARMSNPATRAGVDPLADMMPCAGESCEAPQGTFEARGNLERALEAGQRGRGSESEETLAEAIRDAVEMLVYVEMRAVAHQRRDGGRALPNLNVGGEALVHGDTVERKPECLCQRHPPSGTDSKASVQLLERRGLIQGAALHEVHGQPTAAARGGEKRILPES